MKHSVKIISAIVILFMGIYEAKAQNSSVTIGGTETISDAVLWLIPNGNDGKQGMILPVTEKDGFVPSMVGMIIYDPSDSTVYLWSGNAWQGLNGSDGTSDNWGEQIVLTDSLLTGEGTPSSPLTIASQGASSGEVLKWNGTTWAPAIDETGGSGSTVNSSIEIDGDGTEANPLQLAQQSAANGQVLKWNGTMWAPADDVAGGTGSFTAGSGIEIDASGVITNSGDGDADSNNELQTLSFDPLTNELTLSDGNTITIPSGGVDADADPTNEIQDISFNATTNELTITSGSTITIPSGGTDADADPNNEIQDLNLVGTTLEITGGAGVDLAPLIPPGGTDDQNLIVTGSVLTIEGGAGSVDLATFGDADADPSNELQMLSFDPVANELTLSNGNTITIPTGAADADADPTNEIQDLNLVGTTIEITGGAGVDLSPLIPAGGTDDQNLIVTGSVLTIEGGAGSVDLATFGDADADPSNELQMLSFDPVANELTLSNGNTITIPTGAADADADPTNEIQDLNLVGTTLEITGGVGVDLAPLIPAGGTDNQNLIVTGSVLTIEGGAGSVDLATFGDADADPNNEIQDISYDPATNELTISNGSTVALASASSGAFLSDAGLVKPAVVNGDNFVFGSDQLDDDGVVSDDDKRMFFNKSKGAFRAGSSYAFLFFGEGTMAWDDDNVGNNSFASGSGCTASGNSSFAGGFVSSASADYSTVFGLYNVSTGDASMAIGTFSNSNGDRSFAMGSNSTADGDNSFSGGENGSSIGVNSVALGFHTVAEGENSVAIGTSTIAKSHSSAAFGMFNLDNGDSGNIVGSDPIFTIGNGSSAADRKNAFTVLKNGHIGVGEPDPWHNLVVGTSFEPTFFDLAAYKTFSVGGVGANGGRMIVGNDNTRIEVISGASTNAIGSYQSESVFGDLKIDARTVVIGGTTLNDNPYALTVDLNNTIYGSLLFKGSFGWEQYVNSAGGDLQIYTATELSGIGNSNLAGSFDRTSGAYSSLSDRKTKEDVESMGNVLDKINQLEVLSYRFKNSTKDEKSLGFIAQDVNGLFPEIVSFHEGRNGGEGTFLMNYSGFGVIAIKAIQEQQEEILKQEERIDTLEEQLKLLLHKVECLENK